MHARMLARTHVHTHAYARAHTQLVVLPVNEPPVWTPACLSESGVTCTPPCLAGDLAACAVRVLAFQNAFSADSPADSAAVAAAGGAGGAAACAAPLQLTGFARDVRPSAADAPDERDQPLSFLVVSAGAAPAAGTCGDGGALLAAGTGVVIDARTGDLTLCLAADACGAANFTVTLADGGGDARGGRSQGPAAAVSLEVRRVNQAPEFRAALVVAVWAGSGRHVIGGVVTANATGRLVPTAGGGLGDSEAGLGQSMSFTVTG